MDGNLKLLMIIVDTGCREELEVLMKRHHVEGYTEIPDTHGVGASGVKMGSNAHPKTSSIFFTVLPESMVAGLKADICNYCEACATKMKMFVWGVEEVF
jgi:hypothetical protein